MAIAAKWLRTHRACHVVGVEFNVQTTSEAPDAIGWNGVKCAVVECKVSLLDFKADAGKFFRKSGNSAMGSERWYMAPAGLIPHNLLPPRHGLLEVSPRGTITA